MTINCKGELIDLSTPKIMGILNLTPDSFFDGGKYRNEKEVLLQIEAMIEAGATFIDMGAYSSRPGAAHVSEAEELERILPIVLLAVKSFPSIIISIDTFRSTIAKACIEAGAALINDISAGNLDTEMYKTVGALKVPYIMMHMQGTPATMQNNPSYNNVTQDVLYYFSEKVATLRSHGVNDIIIDPGFGFGKTIAHNYQLLQELSHFSTLDLPVLIGLSRKSMIYKVLESTPETALNGTSILNTIALERGAQILRVHDVKEAQECITLYNTLNQFKS